MMNYHRSSFKATRTQVWLMTKFIALMIAIVSLHVLQVCCNEDLVIQTDDIGNNVCFVRNNNDNNHYFYYNNEEGTNPKVDLKQKCCLEFIESSSIRKLLFVDEGIKGIKHHQLSSLKNCMDQIAIIPLSFHNDDEDFSLVTNSASMVPVYYIRSNADTLADLCVELINEYSVMYSPFHHQSMLNDRSDVEKDQMYQIGHYSSLSKDGGMHRAFMNKISIAFNPKEKYTTTQSEVKGLLDGIHMNGNLIFLFPILEGYFIDLDDPMQEDLDQVCHVQLLQLVQFQEKRIRGCQVEIVTNPKDLVIDIEQPSFASKQHVIAFHIEFNLSLTNLSLDYFDKIDATKTFLELTFVPVIHLRYQRPIIKGGINIESNYINIPVSNIFLHTLSMKTKIDFSTGESDIEYSGLNVAQQLQESQQMRSIIVKVASGLDSHHNIVMVFTILCCILGAIQILRDFSKIGRWY